jgi:hypothetical protein
MPITTSAVSTAVGNVYVSSGNTAITFMSICNYSGGNVTANVYAVPSTGSASDANKILDELEIASGDTYQLYAAGEKLLLANGDSIQLSASANTSLTVVTSFSTI